MVYIVPFKQLIKKLETKSNGQRRVTMTYEEFKDVIKLLLRAVDVNEEWYRREYDDVAAEIGEAKTYHSAKHHFVEEGYFEGRLPRPHVLDEEWYMRRYEDVAEGVRDGSFVSALGHYAEYGYAEGRMPAEY
jgi:hypothetical protein